MGLRPTKTNEGASDRWRGINNLDRAFNRAVPAARPILPHTIVGRPVLIYASKCFPRQPQTRSWAHPSSAIRKRSLTIEYQ